MPENLARFSEVPKQEPQHTPPFVAPDEINPAADLSPASDKSLEADTIARLLGHNDPDRLREALDDDDRARVYEEPPSSVH